MIAITGPTIVAFFPPISHAHLDDPDSNEALSDFQLYASEVREPLRRRGIEFKQISAWSFRIKSAGHIHPVVPRRGVPGYYFVDLGKKPSLHYGVMTDLDILHEATRYFEIH